MADDKELEEFRAWKASKEKEQLFGVLDEWAERSGLTKLLALAQEDDDDGDGGDLAGAAADALKGKQPKAPKEPKADPEPEPEKTSFASRIGLVSNG